MWLSVIKCSETGIHASWHLMNSRKGHKYCDISYLKRKEHILAIFWWIGPVIQNWTLVTWISTRTFHIALVLVVTIVRMLHTELAVAMIASQSNKSHRWFRCFWQHGHLAFSTGPHTEIGFVKHNEILPFSLVNSRCGSKWMRVKFQIFGEPGLFPKRQEWWPFILWRHNENVLWRRSGRLFLLGLLHISVQVSIVDISKLLKFSGSLSFISW